MHHTVKLYIPLKGKTTTTLNSSRHIILLGSLLLLFLAACSKSEEDPSIIYNLEDEFVIRPVESLSRAGSKLTLEITSLQSDLCDNSEILYKFRQIDGVSIIELNDITSPENCNTSDIPPSTNIALNPNGSNRRLLNVKIKEIIENEGHIDEFQNRFEIKMASTNGIRISHRDLFKVQPTMIWGGVDYTSTDSVNVANAFMADLALMVRARPLIQGYYGQFELMPTGSVNIWNDTKSMDNRSAFAFHSEMTLAEMASMVEDYRSRYPTMRFFVYNALGESL